MAKKEEEKALTPKEVAENYFLTHKDLPSKTIWVTSDLVVFYGTIKGKNNCDNYCISAKVGAEEFTNPF